MLIKLCRILYILIVLVHKGKACKTSHFKLSNDEIVKYTPKYRCEIEGNASIFNQENCDSSSIEFCKIFEVPKENYVNNLNAKICCTPLHAKNWFKYTILDINLERSFDSFSIDGVRFDEEDRNLLPLQIETSQCTVLSTDHLCNANETCPWSNWTYSNLGPAVRLKIEEISKPITNDVKPFACSLPSGSPLTISECSQSSESCKMIELPESNYIDNLTSQFCCKPSSIHQKLKYTIIDVNLQSGFDHLIIDGIAYDEDDANQTPFAIISHQSTDCALIETNYECNSMSNCSWFDWSYRGGAAAAAFRVQIEQVSPPFTSNPRPFQCHLPTGTSLNIFDCSPASESCKMIEFPTANYNNSMFESFCCDQSDSFHQIKYTILENHLEYMEDYLFLDGYGYSEADPTPIEIKSNEHKACNFVKTDQFCSATNHCAEWNYSGATSAFLLKVENVPISPYLPQ